MQYFNDVTKTILNDFVNFCTESCENFISNNVKDLIEPFLQHQNMPVSSNSNTFCAVVDDDGTEGATGKNISSKMSQSKKTVELKVSKKPSISSTTKPVAKASELLSVEDFNKLTIGDIQNSTWINKYTVPTLKRLCADLDLQHPTKILKTQLIDCLIQYKKRQETSDTKEGEDASLIEEQQQSLMEAAQSAAVKPKRRLISAPMQHRTVEIIQKHNLNLAKCDDQDILLVLSDENQAIGFISNESFENEEDNPEIKKLTKEIIRLAKNLGISYDSTELLDS